MHLISLESLSGLPATPKHEHVDLFCTLRQQDSGCDGKYAWKSNTKYLGHVFWEARRI